MQYEGSVIKQDYDKYQFLRAIPTAEEFKINSLKSFAGKEVHTSNLNPLDLELIIQFIKENLDEPILNHTKVQKRRFNGFEGMTYGNQVLNPESRLKAP